MSLEEAELEVIVEALLAEGVPTSVVSRALQVNHEDVKLCQKAVRVKRYGTDDLSEYVEQMQWDAISKARDVIANGSSADQTRFVAAILGKQITLAGRRVPEEQRRTAEAIVDMFSEMRTGKSKTSAAPSPFIVKSGDGGS